MSKIHAVLDRQGLVAWPERPRMRAEGTEFSQRLAPNDLWATDYKGEFQSADERYRYPMTVTDHASRYPLHCEAMESNAAVPALTALERLFRERIQPNPPRQKGRERMHRIE